MDAYVWEKNSNMFDYEPRTEIKREVLYKHSIESYRHTLTHSHSLSEKGYNHSQTYNLGWDCGLARFLISCGKLLYVPVGNAITFHQALCTPTIKPVRRRTALLPRLKNVAHLNTKSR